jgi:hypothetical protein
MLEEKIGWQVEIMWAVILPTGNILKFFVARESLVRLLGKKCLRMGWCIQ